LLHCNAWGIGLLLAPEWVFGVIGEAKHGAPAVYSRYGGAWFLGVAIAGFLTLRDVKGRSLVAE